MEGAAQKSEEVKGSMTMQYVEGQKKRRRQDVKGGLTYWDTQNAAKKRKLNEEGQAEVVKANEAYVSVLESVYMGVLEVRRE